METSGQVTFINTLLPFAGIVFIITIGVFLLTQQFRKNLYRQQLAQEELKNKHQLELLRSSFQAEEEERKRIAQDLHDELGATLSITRMHLLQAERLHGKEETMLLSDLQNIRSLTESSLESMRRISHQLMPPQLQKFGLIKTLETIAEQLNNAGTIVLEINVSAELPVLDEWVQVSIYRVFMELINNTLKHAEASKIVLEINCMRNVLVGHYQDNGKGIDSSKFDHASNTEGLGLKSMEGRINSIGGTFEIRNSINGGFSAQLTIPLHS